MKSAQRRIVGFSLESLAAGDKVWGRRAAARFHAYLIEQVDRAPEAAISAGKGAPYRSTLGECALATNPNRSSQP